jgi:hypothetical protein
MDLICSCNGLYFLEILYENAGEYPALWGDEYSDFKNPIGRTFLSGSGIFAETGKSRLSAKPRLFGGEFQDDRADWKLWQ